MMVGIQAFEFAADEVLALINSKPSTPTRDELVAILIRAVTKLVDDHHVFASYPGGFDGKKPAHEIDVPPGGIEWR